MKKDKTISVIKIAIKSIEDELVKSRTKEPEIPINHLELFKLYLIEMLNEINNNEMQDRNNRIKKMSHIILDSWPMNSSIGEKIMLAESQYMNL